MPHLTDSRKQLINTYDDIMMPILIMLMLEYSDLTAQLMHSSCKQLVLSSCTAMTSDCLGVDWWVFYEQRVDTS